MSNLIKETLGDHAKHYEKYIPKIASDFVFHLDIGLQKQSETITKQAEIIAELEVALSKSNKQLADSGNELASYITDKNEELKKGICSTDLDDPEYHCHQTAYESMKLIESNDKLLGGNKQ